MLRFCVFFFHDTPTTEIYTYCHTLSLHELFRSRLPPERGLAERLRVNRGTLRKALARLEYEGAITRHVGRGTFIGHPPTTARSEEHTSELQSLMRNSYAVFCL